MFGASKYQLFWLEIRFEFEHTTYILTQQTHVQRVWGSFTKTRYIYSLLLLSARTRLDWVKTQHISTPWSWSIYTTGRWYCPSLRPCVVAWSNYLSWSEPRPPCVHRQFGVLLLTTTASTSSPITGRRIGSHTGSRLCYVQDRLLQSAVGRSTKVCNWQVAASHGSASCERHEVRPRLDTPASHWAALTRCGRSSHIQAWDDGVQVIAWMMARHRIICLSCAQRSLKLLNDSIFVPPAAINSLFHRPRFQLDTQGRRTFAVAGPTTWNLFQNNLREPDMQIDCFRRTLETFFYQYSAHWAYYVFLQRCAI